MIGKTNLKRRKNNQTKQTELIKLNMLLRWIRRNSRDGVADRA